MSQLKDDLGFEVRDGFRIWLKWIILPLLVTFLVIGGIVTAFYVVQANSMSKEPSSIYNQEDTQATTDLYADSFFNALTCMKLKGAGGCDEEDRKSKMIQNVTSEMLVLNGEKHPIPTKEALLDVVEKTDLSKIEYASLVTDSRGENVDTITYSNADYTVTLNFSQNIEGELLVTSMDVKQE